MSESRNRTSFQADGWLSFVVQKGTAAHCHAWGVKEGGLFYGARKGFWRGIARYQDTRLSPFTENDSTSVFFLIGKCHSFIYIP